MKKVKTQDAIGLVLAQDLTKIVPGEFKGVRFKKGSIIREEDVKELLDMGKEHIYIADMDEPYAYENEGAEVLAKAICGSGLNMTEAREGKVNLLSDSDGVLKIDLEALNAINSIGDIMVSTLHRNTYVKAGCKVASAKIIPLIVSQDKLDKVRAVEKEYGKIIRVNPISSMKVGVLITGNEVYYKRIEDKFAPVIVDKMKQWECPIIEILYSPDDIDEISNKIAALALKGAEIVIVTGGMAVDPDDVTASAIVKAGGIIESYGSPVLPGAVFLVAYRGSVPVVGLPACGMYHKTTIFDILFPRFLSGERILREDIVVLAHGGLCLECKECTYPVCPFGKA